MYKSGVSNSEFDKITCVDKRLVRVVPTPDLRWFVRDMKDQDKMDRDYPSILEVTRDMLFECSSSLKRKSSQYKMIYNAYVRYMFIVSHYSDLSLSNILKIHKKIVFPRNDTDYVLNFSSVSYGYHSRGYTHIKIRHNSWSVYGRDKRCAKTTFIIEDGQFKVIYLDKINKEEKVIHLRRRQSTSYELQYESITDEISSYVRFGNYQLDIGSMMFSILLMIVIKIIYWRSVSRPILVDRR